MGGREFLQRREKQGELEESLQAKSVGSIVLKTKPVRWFDQKKSEPKLLLIF
jgi:hypothetical protein